MSSAEKTPSPVLAEAWAISRIVWELDQLPDDAARWRALAYLCDRFGLANLWPRLREGGAREQRGPS